jgi:hypothetical protein
MKQKAKKRKNNWKRNFLVIVLAIIIAATIILATNNQSITTPTPTPTPSSSPTSTPTPSQTPTPSPQIIGQVTLLDVGSQGYNVIVVQVADRAAWNTLLSMQSSGKSMWVGGNIERSSENEWGFKFKPEGIIIAPITAEALEATLPLIKTNLNYWINIGFVYINAKVVDSSSY